MIPFETLQSNFFPLDWKNKNIILPFSVGRVQTVKPYNLVREKLPLFLMVFTQSGTGKLTYNDREYILSKGDVFFIDCMKKHSYSALSEEWDFCYVHINTNQLVLEYYNELCENGGNVVFHYPQFYKDCLLKLEEISVSPDAKGSVKASICIMDVIMNLLLTLQSDTPDNIAQTINFINENFTSEISVSQLACLAGLSKFYYIRTFCKYGGVTPYEYINSCRINFAKSLLLGSNKSIEEIAGECGFSSVVTFNRCFKTKEEISPSKFRKELKFT